MFFPKIYDGFKVDIWSLGVLLYYIIVGMVPFDAKSIPKLRRLVFHGKFHTPAHLSTELRDLLSLLIAVNPRHRPTVNEIKSHPWLMKDKDNLIDEDELMIPSQPDPDIVRAMERLGFRRQDIKSSLIKRKMNQTMVTYCLLHSQACQRHGPTAQLHSLKPGVTPFPYLEDPVTICHLLSPRRRGSEPALNTLPWSFTNDEMSIWGCQADQRDPRTATGPAMPLHRTVKGTPMDSTAHQ